MKGLNYMIDLGSKIILVWLAFELYKRAFLGFHMSWTSLNCLLLSKKGLGENMALTIFI
jgi:hypothetical protein